MKVKITVKMKQDADIKVIAQPSSITIEFTPEKAGIFEKYGDDALLRSWCKQVIEHNFPHGQFEILHIEKLQTNNHREAKQW
jgi:hypothetical protein